MEKRKIRIYFDGNLFVLFQLFRLQEDWILQEAGSCLENVLTLTVYLCDIDEYGRFNEVYKRYFEKDLPARTCIQAGNFRRTDDHGCILTKKWRADSLSFPSP